MEDRKQDADGCYQPPALDDLALIAAIDGEASPETMGYLWANSKSQLLLMLPIARIAIAS